MTQEQKDAAIAAQQKVVDSANPDTSQAAKDKLAEIKAAAIK